MSQDITVKIDHANQGIMVVGAEALGLKKAGDNKYELPNGHVAEIAEGTVTAEFWGMSGKSIGAHKMVGGSEQSLAQETTGVIRRAGLTETVATHLINDGYETTRDVFTGEIRATRRDEVISVKVGLDGLMQSDLSGFEGDACSMTMQKLLDKLPSHTVEQMTPKVQNAKVVRTQG